MKGPVLSKMSTDELVSRFVDIATEQGDAALGGATAKYNRLFDKMKEVVEELRTRPSDQRRLLVPLYKHSNAHVRMKAAIYTLALEPASARRVLQALVDWKIFPEALDAGMTLSALDDGTFKPT